MMNLAQYTKKPIPQLPHALTDFVSTVGADEEVVRAYIQDREKEDHRVEQLSLFK